MGAGDVKRTQWSECDPSVLAFLWHAVEYVQPSRNREALRDDSKVPLCKDIDVWTDWSKLSSDETALNHVVGRENEITLPLDSCSLDAQVQFVHSKDRSKNLVLQLHTITRIRIYSDDGQRLSQFFKIDPSSKQWNDQMIKGRSTRRRDQWDLFQTFSLLSCKWHFPFSSSSMASVQFLRLQSSLLRRKEYVQQTDTDISEKTRYGLSDWLGE